MELPSKESLAVEFKSDRQRIDDDAILDAVVAMANTDGGSLYVGVEDDGRATGVHKSHRDTTRLAAFIANKTVPPVSVRVESALMPVSDSSVMVIRVEVPKSPVIVSTAAGKMLKRRLKVDGTPESAPMYPFEIVSRLSRLRSYDYSAIPAPDASMQDIDEQAVLRLQDQIRGNKRADKTLIGLSNEELLGVLGMTTLHEGKMSPTITGILLAGKKSSISRLLPTHAAVFQVLDGSAVRVNEDIEGPLPSVVNEMLGRLSAWNPQREYFSGMQRLSVFEFDESAAREGIINAFGHRDYTVLGRVRLLVDEYGMTVTSPGGFVDGVNPNNILQVDPMGRNTCLMDALKRIGMAERTGRGVDRIYEGSLLAGRRSPDWSESTDTYVRLFIPRGLPDEHFMRLLESYYEVAGNHPSVWSMLVLDALKRNGELTVRQLAEVAHASEGKVATTMDELQSYGIVDRKEAASIARYSLNRQMYSRAYDHPGIARDVKTRSEYPDAVLELVRARGSVGNGDVSDMLNIDSKTAYRLLRSMVDDGRLIQRGRKSGTRYYPAT